MPAMAISSSESTTTNGFFKNGISPTKAGKSKEKTIDKVLRLISENPTITTLELADVCDIGENAVYKVVRKLRENGQISRKGGDKGGEWVIL